VTRPGSHCDRPDFALGQIEQYDGSLARQLRDSVRTGGTCRYDPDPDRPVRWIFDG
jgi:hypothetical protein